MRGQIARTLSEQIIMVEKVESAPSDQSAQFKLIDSLIDETARQHIILMHEKNISLQIGSFTGHTFETGKEGKGWTRGNMSGQSMCEKLNGTGLIQLADKGAAIQLSKSGHDFATWLIDSELKASYLITPMGGWGKPNYPTGSPFPFDLDNPVQTDPTTNLIQQNPGRSSLDLNSEDKSKM